MTKTIWLKMVIATLGIFQIARAQDSSKLSYATAVGLIKPTGTVNQVLGSAIAFCSEFEFVNKKNWFADLTFDLTSLKYNQQVKDSTSPFLFQNAKSTFFLIGINAGKKLVIINKNCSVSLYGGGGFLTIGEPRVSSSTDNIIRQTILRKNGVFGRLGSRIEYATRIKILQGIYLEASWWTSPVKIQGLGLNGFSAYLGTRVQIL